jgi:hypothetical protein
MCPLAAAAAIRALRRVIRLIRADSVVRLPGSLALNEAIATAVQTLLLRDWTENVLISIPFQIFPAGQFVDIARQEFRGGRGLIPSDVFPDIEFRLTRAYGPGIVDTRKSHSFRNRS